MQIAPNFKKSEFDSKDGAPMPDDVLDNVIRLAAALQIIRDHFNAPIKINSGYRSPAHNASVGGGVRSQHLKGKAADIVILVHHPDEVAETIEQLIAEKKIPQGGLGRYNTFTHYDIRGRRARWDYRK